MTRKSIIASKKQVLIDKNEVNEILPIVFSFEKMEQGITYSIDKCPNHDLVHFIKKIFEISNMTWCQIRRAYRHGRGSEKITKLDTKKGLKHVPKGASFLSIRYCGKKPFIGYRENRIFHVLLIDHDRTAYKHGN
ncbi:hypothetical protein C0030_005935 [Candidatus Liberibacter solanacearum]|uniref:Uncharacterized protein n=1 Tax=Candidatus Liberibacter solanacearum TaxID=556287 RepID=A0A3R7QTW7_9HYPH|nr:hypothetical protein [Candidatus Liberibacter solanacearum]RPD36772.1 hypothetical protein C0030_005935 [Candidatus Liberibacter solanacearum]